MNQDDADIKEIFDRLKAADAKEVEIPDFELPERKRRSSRLRYLVPIGVAASLLLYFGINWDTGIATAETQETVITLSLESPSNTDDFISEETSISQWKSPSDILIQEFED